MEKQQVLQTRIVETGTNNFVSNAATVLTDWYGKLKSQLSQKAQEYFDTRLNRKDLADRLAEKIREASGVKDGNLEFQRGKAFEYFASVLPADMLTDKQKTDLFKVFAKSFLDEVFREAQRSVREGAKSGDQAKMAAGLDTGRQAATTMADHGFGTAVGNQKQFLDEVCKGLTQQQIQDILRAAMQTGFSSTAVFSSAQDMGVDRDFIQQLQFGASERAANLMRGLTEVLQDDKLDEKERKKKVEGETRKLAAVIDRDPEVMTRAEKIEKSLESAIQKGQDAIEEAIADNVAHAQAILKTRTGDFQNVAVMPERKLK